MILIVLLPKCGLCLVAYTSTAALCSGRTLMLEWDYGGLAFIFPFGMITFWGVWKNFRGKRTFWAMGLIIIGFAMILSSFLGYLQAFLYYCGSGLMWIGIWLNGSLYYVINSFKNIMINLKPMKYDT